MDTHAFASLAHVRVLLVPVGSIAQSTFEAHAAEIRSFDTIRLGDIPADSKDHRARFMPNALSAGHLHLSFPTHPPPAAHQPLSLIRPSHFPLAVIGIASCSQTDAVNSMFVEFNSLLAGIMPSRGIFPLARSCFAFEEGEGNVNLHVGDVHSGLVVIPSMGNKKLYIGTLLADLCSKILAEFGVVVQALETPLGNEYLNSSLMPILPPLSELDSSSSRDTSTSLPSHNSQPEFLKSGFALTPTPQLKRNTSGPAFRQSTLGTQPPSKKRLSGLGVASSHGRLFKVLGDFFLMAGRTEDALIWYTEALLLLKNSQDTVWHAATMEGMATVAIIDAWSAGHGLNNSTGATKDPWSETSEKLAQATALYQKSTVSDPDHHSLLAYLYTCAVLRHSSLLFAVWSAKGWGPLAFTTMLQPGPMPYLPPTLTYESNMWVQLERLTLISGVTRSAISTVLSQAHGPWLLHLGPRERIAVLEAMASLYACLGYRRKEAYVLREVLGCVLDLLVCGREEDGNQDRPDISTPGPSGQPGAFAKGTLGVRPKERTDGNESILKLLKYVCKVFGIDLEAVRLVEGGKTSDREHDSLRSGYEEYERDIVDSFKESYGWSELQVGVIREAVAVAEALPEYPAVAQFALSSLKTLQSVLTAADQHHLYATSARALVTSQRRGDQRSVEYWSGRPIVSISITPLPLPRLPIEKPISALKPSTSDLAPILTGGTDPFLYNPRKLAASQGKTLLISNDSLELLVTLQNPYVFDLDLQELSLSTSGVRFESKPISVSIPAHSDYQVALSGKALETGTLTIRGCFVQAPGGIRREFLLPISGEEDEESWARKRSAFLCEAGRSKYSGLSSFPWEKPSNRTSIAAKSASVTKPLSFMECKVVPEQPLLRIRRTNVTHGAVMLYDGEISVIRITIENVSPLPIDFLRLVFEDSTIPVAQQLLADGDLSVFDTYETEYGLIRQPVFSWNADEARDILPGQKLTLNIKSFGKVGCTNGTIHFSYSFVHRPDLNSDVFYTRQLSYPLMVTVYHMLECHSMNVFPLPSYLSSLEKRNRSWQDNLLVDDEGSWCLFSIDVRNAYGLPFEVTFERTQEGTDWSTSVTTVPPGAMTRIILPLKRFRLPESQTSQPIPTLSDRQFVVNKAKISVEESMTQRELFWYREELFKIIRGHWRESGGTRTGDLSLREQRMTLPMLEALQLPMTTVHVYLGYRDSKGNLVDASDTCHPPSNDLVYLRTRVENLAAVPVTCILDLDVEPFEHIVHEGILRNISVGRLNSGESREVEVALCFLAHGKFVISAEVRLGDSNVGAAIISERAGIGRLIVTVEESPE